MAAIKVCKVCGHGNPSPTGDEYDACPACDRIYSRVDAALQARRELDLPRRLRTPGLAVPAKPRGEPAPSAPDKGSNDALVPCTECGHQVSPHAETCPNCGIKRMTRQQESAAGLAAVLVFAFIIWALAYVMGDDTQKDYCGAAGERPATLAAREAVRRQLRAPSTARFGDAHVRQGPGSCVFRVWGYVDSQNAFGAMIRSHYSADIRYDKYLEQWQSSNVSVF